MLQQKPSQQLIVRRKGYLSCCKSSGPLRLVAAGPRSRFLRTVAGLQAFLLFISEFPYPSMERSTGRFYSSSVGEIFLPHCCHAGLPEGLPTGRLRPPAEATAAVPVKALRPPWGRRSGRRG